MTQKSATNSGQAIACVMPQNYLNFEREFYEVKHYPILVLIGLNSHSFQICFGMMSFQQQLY